MTHPPQIPLTPQTDERNFPRWQENAPPGQSGHAYPKMLTRPCTREDREQWLATNKRIDANTRQEYYDNVAPRVGSPIPIIVTQEMVDDGLAQLAGEPVVVNDKEEEARVRAFLGLDAPPPKPGIVQIPIPLAPAAAAPKPIRRRRRRVARPHIKQQEHAA
jgi:hypothetical protein